MISIARFAGTLADKYGPRWLLIGGPALAGTGLLVLSFVKQTNGPSDYWTTFFPGVLLFGLGMSFTVAPLTATVMGSVSDHLSGTASGVNNAVSRIAGVFANAVFGALAVLFFLGALQTQVIGMNLNPKAEQAVMVQAADLGNAKAPALLEEHAKEVVQHAYRDSFIASYGKIMKLSATLGYLGALMSFLFIKNRIVKKSSGAA
jgi:MFS family permease